MARAATDSVTTIEDLDIVVDADAHVQEELDEILPYMDESDRGLRNIVEDYENPTNDIYSVTHAGPIFINADFYGMDGDYTGHHSDEDPEDLKLTEMDDFGIDRSVVTPSLGLATITINNARIAVALSKAYNRWLVDFLEGEDRFVGAALANTQKPDRAAEHIDDVAGEDKIAGVMIPSPGGQHALGHEWYHPIYEAAEDNGLPIVLHSGTLATEHSFPKQYWQCQTYVESHIITHPFAQMWALTSIMYQGIPERFPDLEFVFQEAGIGWVPYTIWRLDDHYLEMGDEVPYLSRLPSAYVEDQFYFTTQPLGHTETPAHMAKMVELAGPENVMYSADLPHPDFDTPEELFGRIRSLSDEDVRAIMGETAADVFGIE